MSKDKWWKNTSIYQVYPRSYFDSSGNGIGDLPGIISKLDYIKELGFETIWFSPFFDSPQADFGYDVSDYFQPAPEYGTQQDIFKLIDEVHYKGMKIVFDLVLNHTSDQHPWFLESRSCLDNPKRDWYIWKDGKGRKPPNNWKAMPGGSGWHYDDKTGQWYYASFLPFQPDLNFRNPEVKSAMLEMIKFWLDREVDGFRLDIFHSVYKDKNFRDNPFSRHFLPYNDEAGFFQEWKYTVNQPETLSLAKEIRKLIDSYQPERFLLGEIFADDQTKRKYLGELEDGLNLVFSWDLPDSRIDAVSLRKVIMKYEEEFPDPYRPVYVLGNHDRKRVYSRAGENIQLAKLLAVLIFTARGVPVTYYGEEIGMVEGEIPISSGLDPIGQRYKFLPKFLVDALNIYLGRDGCRTPMQWSTGDNAGFSNSKDELWLPLSENHLKNNVEKLKSSPDSILNLYKKLLALRRELPVLRNGQLKMLDVPVDTLAYDREIPGEIVGVFMNFSDREIQADLSNPAGNLLLSVSSIAIRSGRIHLGPFSAGVIRYKT